MRKDHTPVKENVQEKRLKLSQRKFTTLKASSIPFMPNAPYQTMRQYSPNIYVAMSPKLCLPRLKKLNNCMRHNLVDTKQTK